MSEQRFDTSKTPHVTITLCKGDVMISSWIGSAVKASGTNYTGEIPQFDSVTISSETDLELVVPSGSDLTLEEVHGNLIIKHVEGNIILKEGRGEVSLNNLNSVVVHTAHKNVIGENVNGPLTIVEALADVHLRNVGELQVERVHNDLSVHYVNGSVELGEVTGCIDAHTVSGDLSVGRGHGDANLSNLGGRINLPEIGGEIRLNGGLASGEHFFRAEGDIIVRWPVDAPLSLIATGSLVHSQLRLLNHQESDSENNRTTLTGHIEEGKTTLILNSANKIGLKAIYGLGREAFDLADFDFDFEKPLEPVPAAETAPDDSVAEPSSETSPQLERQALSQKITADIVEQLALTNPDMDLSALKLVVASAVDDSLADLSWPPAFESSPTPIVKLETVAQQAAEKAKAAVEKSLRQAKESIEQARQKTERTAEHPPKPKPESAPPSDSEPQLKTEPQSETGPQPTAQPDPTPTPSESLTTGEKMVTEEQLHILGLLKDGQISVEQAKILLDALEKK